MLETKLLSNIEAMKLFRQCTHSVTFTLKPELYLLPASKQLKKAWKVLYEYLRMFTASFICCAELTKDDNIHFHAVLQPSKLHEYSLDMLKDSLKNSHIMGSCYINPHFIDSNGAWLRTYSYMTKEYDKTHRIVNINIKKYDIIFYWQSNENKEINSISNNIINIPDII